MNYFRCTVGGSGKGNTVTVTCAEEFAGLTITLAKTGKTYTKTCPSTAPYVVTFYGVENGTYTVSCTVDGETYSETVIVQDISCVLNYGFTWRTWVDTASQLDSSDYDTLDEVLADEKALRELFLEHACVDYMAESAASNEDLETVINNDLCAKWINLSDYALDILHANEVIADLMDEADKYGYGEWALMPQVPTMTSNTAPYGEASASSNYNSSAYNAFDGNDSIAWLDEEQTNSSPYIQYHFVTPIKVSRIKAKFEAHGGMDSYTISGSNDGTNFTPLVTEERTWASGTTYDVTSDVSGNNSYSYLRFTNNNKPSDASPRLYTLQFYAWAPKGNVPVMTADNAPYGTATTNANSLSARNAYFCFDNNINTYAAVDSGYLWVCYQFATPVCIKEVGFITVDRCNSFEIQADNVDGNFVTIYDGVAENKSGYQHFKFNNDGFYLRWRMLIKSTYQNNATIWALQFYGRELKVSVPTMTSNTAPYGVASASSIYSNVQDAYKAFDGNANNLWSANSKTDQYIEYEFVNPMKLELSVFTAAYIQSRRLFIYSIQAYDGSQWVDLTGEIGIGTQYTSNYRVVQKVSTNRAYNKYRIFGSGEDNVCISSIQFYGLDYSEKEFETGTTKKWLYDHGVELETINNRNVDPANAVKESNQLKISSSTGNCGFIISALDLTGLNLLRAKVGLELSNLTNGCLFAYDGANAYRLFDVASCPNNQYLDVSSYSTNTDVFFETYNNNQATKLTLTEWWLE